MSSERSPAPPLAQLFAPYARNRYGICITTATYQMEYSDGDEWSVAKHIRLRRGISLPF